MRFAEAWVNGASSLALNDAVPFARQPPGLADGNLMPPHTAGRRAGRRLRTCRRRHAPVAGYVSPGAADRAGAAGRGYGRAGNCWSAQVLPSGSLKVTNEPQG
jgi:hypothetical protein